MPNTELSNMVEHTAMEEGDWLLVSHMSAPVGQRSKKIKPATVASYMDSAKATITQSDADTYVMWEKGTAYTVVRLVDGFFATITNNPTMTTAALAWTNRATLTYSVDGN